MSITMATANKRGSVDIQKQLVLQTYVLYSMLWSSAPLRRPELKIMTGHFL